MGHGSPYILDSTLAGSGFKVEGMGMPHPPKKKACKPRKAHLPNGSLHHSKRFNKSTKYPGGTASPVASSELPSNSFQMNLKMTCPAAHGSVEVYQYFGEKLLIVAYE